MLSNEGISQQLRAVLETELYRANAFPPFKLALSSGLFYFHVPSGKIISGVPFLCLNRRDASQMYYFFQFLMQFLKFSCSLSLSLVMGKCRIGCKIFCALI